MSDLKPIPDQYQIDQSILNKTRQDKFLMILNLPNALISKKTKERSNKRVDFDALQFSVFGAPVPDIIIPAIGQYYQGQELKVSSHSREPYENIFVDFTVDNLYRNWWVIYSWLNFLNDERVSYYDKDDISPKEAWEASEEYRANFTVFGLDEYDNPVIRFDYIGAFPVSLTSPKFSDQNPEEIRSGFEFAFTFFDASLV